MRPVTCLNRFLLSFISLSALFAEGCERKRFTSFCPGVDCQDSLCFLHTQSLIAHFATLSEMPQPGLGPVNCCRELLLARWSVISFPSIILCPGIHIIFTLLCSTCFVRDWWQSQTNFELILKLSSTLIVV